MNWVFLKFENENLSAYKIILEPLGVIFMSQIFPACWFLPKPLFWHWTSGLRLPFLPGELALGFLTWPFFSYLVPHRNKNSSLVPLRPSYDLGSNLLKVWKWWKERTILKALHAIFRVNIGLKRMQKQDTSLQGIKLTFKKKITCQEIHLKPVCFYSHPQINAPTCCLHWLLWPPADTTPEFPISAVGCLRQGCITALNSFRIFLTA